MANININNLQPLECEICEISDSESIAISGGFLKWLGNKIEDGWKSLWRKVKDINVNWSFRYEYPKSPSTGSNPDQIWP
jgi:hypothetical protein